MLNCTKQICRCITVKKALLMKSSILRPAVPTSSLSGPPIIIKRCVHSSYSKKSFCSNYYICLIRSFVEYLSPWFILRKLGIPVKHIIKFRRGIKRFSIPWLSYSVPTALAMGVGDILAQVYCSPYKVKDNAKGNHVQFLQKKISLKQLDLRRTAKFMLIGFLVMGPIRSKWNAFTCRSLSYNTPQMYMIKRVAMDVFILSPILLIIGLALWDFDKIYNSYPKLKPVWENRLEKPFLDIMKFNLMTRPIMDIIICMLIPTCLRKLVRRPYEIIFFAYVSAVIAKYKLGFRPKKESKPQHTPAKTKNSWGRKKK